MSKAHLSAPTKTFNGSGLVAVGPQKWRTETIKGIKLSNGIVEKSANSIEAGKCSDPLPHLREFLQELSNDEAFRYFREVRAVLNLIRHRFGELNEEIKNLYKVKESLERALFNKRKDLKVNEDSIKLRTQRPNREKNKDGADDLLQAEHMNLLNAKKMLEMHLELVQEQLQILDKVRDRVMAVIQERSRVVDLVNNSLHMTTSAQGPRASAASMRTKGRKGASSVPCINNWTIDALGPYTPEVDLALKELVDTKKRGENLRHDALDLIKKTDNLMRQVQNAVNNGLSQKVSETLTLKHQLELASGKNRFATQKAQRWYDTTEKSYQISRGPHYSSDLVIHERLDRPIMSVFQRHPGQNMPECQEIIRGGNGLLQSMNSTSRNIGLLKLAQLRLKNDISDKRSAIDVDSSIVRLRKRKGNHRWSLGEAF